MTITNLRWVRNRAAGAPICTGGATREGRDELVEIIDRHLRGETTRAEFLDELSVSTVDALLREGANLPLFSRRLVAAFAEWRVLTSAGSRPEKNREVSEGSRQFAYWYQRERGRAFELFGFVRKMLELREWARARSLVEHAEQLIGEYRRLELAWWPIDFCGPGRSYPHLTLIDWIEQEKARFDTQLIRASGPQQDEIPF